MNCAENHLLASAFATRKISRSRPEYAVKTISSQKRAVPFGYALESPHTADTGNSRGAIRWRETYNSSSWRMDGDPSANAG